MNVAEAVGRALAEHGVRQVFGVVGSGNFHVTNALVGAGARYVAARHEGGAATMADAYARLSDEVAAVSLHQGCGLTNAMTGLAEAAKSRTPVVVLAGEATAAHSNFAVDQSALATAVGAVSMRVESADVALVRAAEAVAAARDQRRTVLLNLPLDVQAEPLPETAQVPSPTASPASPVPDTAEITRMGELLGRAERPVIIAGRGARHARAALIELADACGALVATSAVARGLFNGSPWSLDVCGGFASPAAADLIGAADVIAAFGCTLTRWTTRHGALIGDNTTVIQVDDDPAALGRHHRVDLPVLADAATAAAGAATAAWQARDATRGYRDEHVQRRLIRELRWRDIPYEDWGTGHGSDARIDPRTLTIALDDMLPTQRVVAVDSGNFMGYPSMFLSVPDEYGFCFTQAFQSVGLGLATAIGAALAQPDRLPVAALGDGGAFMAAAELDTVCRLGLPMIIVIYDDAAYGAEVHHFGTGYPLGTVTFPDTDIAAIGAGYGFDTATVRTTDDLRTVRAWLSSPQARPLLVDAKIASPRGAWWLEDAFR